MALWSAFVWSDGTKWADGNGKGSPYTTHIDRKAYHVSVKITHTNAATPGSVSSFVIQDLVLELGVRSQLPNQYEAFVDRNTDTQRISVKVTHTATGSESSPFTIDHLQLLVKAKRQQPTG